MSCNLVHRFRRACCPSHQGKRIIRALKGNSFLLSFQPAESFFVSIAVRTHGHIVVYCHRRLRFIYCVIRFFWRYCSLQRLHNSALKSRPSVYHAVRSLNLQQEAIRCAATFPKAFELYVPSSSTASCQREPIAKNRWEKLEREK
jgi:hypothetical protein